MNFVWFLIVGLVAGWLAGTLVKGGGFGLVGDLIVGVVGAFLGGFLFSTLGVSSGGGLLGSIIVATIGAVVLLFLIRLIKRASSPKRDSGLARAPRLARRERAMLCSRGALRRPRTPAQCPSSAAARPQRRGQRPF